MISTISIENALLSWASSVVNPAIVILADQNAPTPLEPYLTVKILNISKVGFDHESHPDLSDQVTHTGPRMITVELQAFGPTAFDLLESLQASLDRTTTAELLSNSNLSFMRTANSIIDISSLLETEIQRRATLDVIFGIGSQETETIPYTLDPETLTPDGTGSGQINIDTNYQHPDGSPAGDT